MRLLIAIFVAGLFLPGTAYAQKEPKVWTAAPVPGTLPQRGSPANRDGGTTGPEESAPFSSLPSGGPSGDQPSETSGENGPTTGSIRPNLSK